MQVVLLSLVVFVPSVRSLFEFHVEYFRLFWDSKMCLSNRAQVSIILLAYLGTIVDLGPQCCSISPKAPHMLWYGGNKSATCLITQLENSVLSNLNKLHNRFWVT